MDVFEAIHGRRSIKRFAPRPIGREEIERLLDAAVQAPNHRMTEPWGFVVLGEETKRAYAELHARLKADKAEDEAASARIHAKVLEETVAVPAIIAVTTHLAQDPVVREEDYAATYMAIQNLLLGAAALGLGTRLRTGKILDEAELRAALEVERDRRVVAVVYLGEPSDVPARKRRAPASEKTRWLP